MFPCLLLCFKSTCPQDIEQVFKELMKGVQAKTGLEELSAVMPEYAVVNQYLPNQSIGSHSDCDPLFDAVDNEAVILSFNVAKDCVFEMCLQHLGEKDKCSEVLRSKLAAKYYGPGYNFPKKPESFVKEHNLKVYVAAPENSVIVMGGHFQSQMHHATVSHNEANQASAGGRPGVSHDMEIKCVDYMQSPRQRTYEQPRVAPEPNFRSNYHMFEFHLSSHAYALVVKIL